MKKKKERKTREKKRNRNKERMTQKGNLNKGHQSPESECHQRRRLCVGVRAQKQIRLFVFSAAASFCSKSFCFQKLKTQTKIKRKNYRITLTNAEIVRAFLGFHLNFR